MSLSTEPTPEPVFDNPALREAVRRAWAGERAPAGLRDRITRALREDPQAPAPAATGWRIGSVRQLAAAAVVLLAVGGVAGYFAGVFGEGRTPVASRIPATLVTQLAQVHLHCSDAPDHHGAASSGTDDFQVIATRLRSQLGRPVLVCAAGNPDGAGQWTFRGAAVCQVGEHAAGHLVFVRGQAAVSVFSLPAGACPLLPANERCESQGLNCDVAAFRQGEGFFCVVGSSKDGSLTCEQVRGLRDRLRPNVIAAGSDSPPPARAARAAFARGGF
jgi:hypothetical protein